MLEWGGRRGWVEEEWVLPNSKLGVEEEGLPEEMAIEPGLGRVRRMVKGLRKQDEPRSEYGQAGLDERMRK